MDKFLKEYDGHRFEDCGCYCSDDFKSFARKFKNYLKRSLPKEAEIVGHSCNHYDLSGFIRLKEKYVYYSYTWNRCTPVKVHADHYLNDGVLLRLAESDHDYIGKTNHFVSIADLPSMAEELLRREVAA